MCHCLVINWTVPHRFGGLLFKWWGNMLSFNRYTVKEYYRVIDKSNNINNTETNCQHSCFHCKWNKYPLVISHSHGKSAFLIGKSSISMGHLYHGYVSHNQMVILLGIDGGHLSTKKSDRWPPRRCHGLRCELCHSNPPTPKEDPRVRRTAEGLMMVSGASII